MPLVVGVVLLAIGVGLLLYGSTLPEDYVVHGLLDYSAQDMVNFLMVIGLIPIFVGASFLLYWLLTRSKPAKPSC